ncbi:MAG: tRNA (guanosine(46)-N7)-methyltransferase TrmB [Methylococcaceae bacterium]|nr:tRNA (guanosine(46)-N7)-methyltransferase TrmB [Methylococcaceae bacterium]
MSSSESPEITHHIRSFIRRQGRATAGQKLAIDMLWDKYCLDPEKDYNFSEEFNNNAPVIMEIGFGDGDSLAKMAAANPHLIYSGIEVHKAGIVHLMLLLEQQHTANVRIYYHDAIEILENRIADNTLSGVQLFFPDPWQKRKHHKRRIVRPEFLKLLLKKLVSDGYFHAATDWQHYAKDMLKILSAEAGLINTSPTKTYCERPDYRPLTKFEQRGIRLGHGVWDLVFKKP